MKPTVSKASKEGGGCVNTQTGSVRVAASQSNIVRPEDSLREAEGVLPQLIRGLLFDSPWTMGDPSLWAMGDQPPSTGGPGGGGVTVFLEYLSPK